MNSAIHLIDNDILMLEILPYCHLASKLELTLILTCQSFFAETFLSFTVKVNLGHTFGQLKIIQMNLDLKSIETSHQVYTQHQQHTHLC